MKFAAAVCFAIAVAVGLVWVAQLVGVQHAVIRMPGGVCDCGCADEPYACNCKPGEPCGGATQMINDGELWHSLCNAEFNVRYRELAGNDGNGTEWGMLRNHLLAVYWRGSPTTEEAEQAYQARAVITSRESPESDMVLIRRAYSEMCRDIQNGSFPPAPPPGHCGCECGRDCSCATTETGVGHEKPNGAVKFDRCECARSKLRKPQ